MRGCYTPKPFFHQFPQGWHQRGKGGKHLSGLAGGELEVGRDDLHTQNRFESLASPMMETEMKTSTAQPVDSTRSEQQSHTNDPIDPKGKGRIREDTGRVEKERNTGNSGTGKGKKDTYQTIDNMTIADLEKLIEETKQKYDQESKTLTKYKQEPDCNAQYLTCIKTLEETQLYLRDKGTVISCEIDKRRDDESAQKVGMEGEGEEDGQFSQEKGQSKSEHMYPPPYKLRNVTTE
ncbi:UNVERIFIED_CONTAM: hypothetical protein K2H54_056756 [Gekko kuhli]